ncbi:hypothetical protein EO98_03635 [Methanosarcina sp. 2.H.T.1A.6]|nr:hypothetical protein EO97_14610 [Methanosarcina sp. 2.H.T.1A.15]KKG18477.1 hypothetical protein EO94_04690 [Methanosarcina sp. 2.H.T.1A.3]KKG20678.1 hypothetical protein EO98_03635 [Methanosarcina sp. 2.H.T.1A.6]KKG23238.1 hypothetical protein EO96_02165 [Methanosarcina sp. 2.H.T.1A.8]
MSYLPFRASSYQEMALKIVPGLQFIFKPVFQVTGGTDTDGVAREFRETDLSFLRGPGFKI